MCVFPPGEASLNCARINIAAARAEFGRREESRYDQPLPSDPHAVDEAGTNQAVVAGA
jgi:hypothetical protein